MTTHVHSFVHNRTTGRYRCECGVWGRKVGDSKLVAMVCQKQLDHVTRERCGADAVHVVMIDRNSGRCVAHLPATAAKAAS